jgi:hypothetical protein
LLNAFRLFFDFENRAHNQWYEGTVTQYDVMHGRHCVVYDDGEQKWYHMANKTFYVVSPPSTPGSNGSLVEGVDDDELDEATKNKLIRLGRYSKRRERVMGVVDISIPPPSFKPVSLSLSRSLLFKKHPNKSFLTQ